MSVKCELYHDNFQNFKTYGIPKAQLVIADIPYNIGVDAYASNPMWYRGGTTRTVKVKRQKRLSLITMECLKSLSTCISVIECLSKSRKNGIRPLQ